MQTPSILVVDDDLALLEALPHLVSLRMHGVKVDTCDSAEVALDLIREHDYDVIVSDIKMPGMDGLELLSKIQELRPDTPTLLITGHMDQENVVEALRRGAYDFIQKPIDRLYFVAALHRAMQTRSLQRTVQEQQAALAHHTQDMVRAIEDRTRDARIATRTLEGLVHDLLAASLMVTNKFSLWRAQADLADICRETVEEYAQEHGYLAGFETLELGLIAEVDRERFGQALAHLLMNAFTYSPPDSHVSVMLERQGEEARISVHDYGPGIADEARPHIFELFYQGPESELRAAPRPRFGLGLYLAGKIIEAHGGRLEFRSEPGYGSSFSLILPLQQQGEQQVGEPEADQSAFQPPNWLVS